MGVYGLHSIIVDYDFLVDDLERMWKSVKQHRPELTSIGASHVVMYTSVSKTMAVSRWLWHSQPRSIRDVSRSPAIFGWFDVSPVDFLYGLANGSISPTPRGVDVECLVGKYAHLMSIE